MALQELEKGDWKAWMDALTRQLGGVQVTVPVAQLPLEEPCDAEQSRLVAVVYDPPGDIFTVSAEDFDHFIDEPTSISVELDGEKVRAVRVVDPAGTTHAVPLSESLAGPAVSADGSARRW